MRPSILIGLGGTGSAIVHNVYKRFSEEDRKKLAVLVFDTDAGDMKKLNSLNSKEQIINLGQNKTVATFLKENSKRKNEFGYLETDRQITNKNMSKGAAQVRMLSRLAYEVMDQKQFGIIMKQISSIFGNDLDPNAPVNIYYVSSLCGGTGSGILLQLAFLLKNYINEVNQRAVLAKAVVMFPDIFTTTKDVGAGKSESEKLRMAANTYAFFKEWKTYNDIFQGNYPYGRDQIKNLSLNIGQLGGGLGYLNENNLSKGSTVLSPIDVFAGIDAVGAEATHLKYKKNYDKMTEDFLFLDIASNIGSLTESRTDNALSQAVMSGGLNKFSSFGIAKIVYPYHDLLKLAPAIQISEILNDSWLTIDNRFEVELRAYKDKREKGEQHLQSPNRKDFFINALDEFAKVGHHRNYFKTIKQSLTHVTHDEFSVESGRFSLEKMFVDNVMGHLNREIRNSKYSPNKTTEVNLLNYFEGEINRLFKALGIGTDNVAETVTRIEKLTTGFKQQVKNVFEARYDALCSYYLNMSEENLSSFDNQKKNIFNLSYYLLGMNLDTDNRKPLHPLAVRYFLYKTYNILQHKLSLYKKDNTVANDHKPGKVIELERAIEGYGKIDYFDETPEIDDIAKAVALSQDVDSKFFKKAMSKIFGETRLEELLNDYETRTTKHVSELKEYYIASIEYEVLTRLAAKISNLIDYWEAFYKKLGQSVSNKNSIVNTIILEYGTKEQSSSLTGNHYLFEKYDDRKQFILDRFAQDGFKFENFEHELTEILYKESLVDYSKCPMIMTEKEVLDKDFENLALEKLRLNIKKSKILDLNIAEALQAEATMKEIDTFEYVNQTLSMLATKAGPFMLPSQNSTKRSFNTWGINDDVSRYFERILENEQYSGIFGDENVIVQGEFVDPNKNIFYNKLTSISKYEIIRSNHDYNFGLENLSSFLNSSYTDKEPSLDTIFTNGGRLFQSYYEHKLSLWFGNDVSGHLDSRWDGLYILTDINDGIDKLLEKEVKKAFVRGMALKYFINATNSEKQKTWRLNLPDDNKFILDSHGEPVGPYFYDLYNSLIDNIGTVLRINGYRNPSNIVETGYFQKQFDHDYHVQNYNDWDDHAFIKKSLERIHYLKHPKIDYNLLDVCFVLHHEKNTDIVKNLGKELLGLVISEYIDYHKKVYAEDNYGLRLKNVLKELLKGSYAINKTKKDKALRKEWLQIILAKLNYRSDPKIIRDLFNI